MLPRDGWVVSGGVALMCVQPEGLREGQQVEGHMLEPRSNWQALQVAEQGRPVSRLQGLHVPPLLLQVTTAGLTEDTETPGLGHQTVPTGEGSQLHQNQGTVGKRWPGRPAGLHAVGKSSWAHTGDREALGSLSSWAEGLSQRCAKLLSGGWSHISCCLGPLQGWRWHALSQSPGTSPPVPPAPSLKEEHWSWGAAAPGWVGEWRTPPQP